MAIFQSNTCAAFTWDDNSQFYGALLERHGDTVKVKHHWCARREGKRSPAQMLESGFPSLKPDEDTTVIIGGNFRKCCFVDLTMPKLAATDLKNAVQFELGKHSPVPVDDLSWGYRIIGKMQDSELYRVRVAYFPQSEWESWVAAASGVAGGVDMIIPPTVAVDPILADADVCLAPPADEPAFAFKSGEDGKREVVFSHNSDTTMFGAGDDPLKLDGLDIGSLSDLPPHQQQPFAAAIILGMYGISDSFYHDRSQWLNVPYEMRPKRNRAAKIYTMLISVYLCFLLGIIFSSFAYENYTAYKHNDAEIRRLQAQVDDLTEPSDDEAFSQEFEVQIDEVNLSLFHMADALLEVTGIAGPQLWATNFNWDAGDLRVEFKAAEDQPDLILPLQESLLFADFTMRKRQITDGVNYTINCRMKTNGELRDSGFVPLDPDRVRSERRPPAEEEPEDDGENGDDFDDTQEDEEPAEEPEVEPEEDDAGEDADVMDSDDVDDSMPDESEGERDE